MEREIIIIDKERRWATHIHTNYTLGRKRNLKEIANGKIIKMKNERNASAHSLAKATHLNWIESKLRNIFFLWIFNFHRATVVYSCGTKLFTRITDSSNGTLSSRPTATSFPFRTFACVVCNVCRLRNGLCSGHGPIWHNHFLGLFIEPAHARFYVCVRVCVIVQLAALLKIWQLARSATTYFSGLQAVRKIGFSQVG